MKKASEYRLTIESLDPQGAGVGTVKSAKGMMTLHVVDALPGEDIDVEVLHVSPHRTAGVQAWGRVLRRRSLAQDRVTAQCRPFEKCGGCPVQRLRYSEQLQWKRHVVQQALSAALNKEMSVVQACVASPQVFAYRNQSKLVFGPDRNNHTRLGAYAARSHTVVDMNGCLVPELVLQNVAQTLRGLLREHEIQVMDPRTLDGTLRHVALRANEQGQCLVTLVVPQSSSRLDEVVSALCRAHPEIVGVVENLNDQAGDGIFGTEERVLAGVGFIEDRIAGQTVQLSSRAFFQLNRAVAGLIYVEVQKFFGQRGEHKRVVDAYAGVGAIGALLLEGAQEVVAIENNPAVLQPASDVQNALPKLRFVIADAAQGLADIDKADGIVVNPPRSGCSAEVVDEMARLRPRTFAYVSCNPVTLGRDLQKLVEAGLHIESIVPFDMLPHTAHVETLVLGGFP